MRIIIIGTGNTATVLGKLFQRNGHTIEQVIGRTMQNAEQLGEALHAPFTVDSKDLQHNADIYLVAVTDNSIQDVATWLRVDKKLVVHTAASAKLDVLKECTKNYGVLYPLQSLRKEVDEIPMIPFLVDANTEENRTLLTDFARSVSSQVRVAGDEQRIMTHVAAVIVSNFTNHLYVLTEQFCKEQDINFADLLPLISEVANRLGSFSPSRVQTGPAVRNDMETIQKHVGLLAAYPEQQAIYNFLTESIIRWHS